AEHTRGSGTDALSVGQAARPLRGVWAVPDGGRGMAPAPSGEAFAGWRRWFGQLGVAACQLPPPTTQPGSWGRTEPRLARGVCGGLSRMRGNSHVRFLGGR